jgi:endonuclease YncB( thermonuclease family)
VTAAAEPASACRAVRRLPSRPALRARAAVLLMLMAGVASLPAATAADPAGAAGGEGCLTGRPAATGDALVLDQPVDGRRQLRLAGVLAPAVSPAPAPATDAANPPVGKADGARADGARADGARADWATVAVAGLAGLVAGQCLSLSPDVPPTDRHGRLVARVYRRDGLALDEHLVGRGLVRVMPGIDDRPVAASLLAREEAARQAGLGIWADPAYGVRSADALAGAIGSVQLVEGEVERAARAGGRIYLNFGSDWRRDFTVVIPARRLRAFLAAGVDPLALAGRRVRVRGLIEDVNGPQIEVEAPEAIEILATPGRGERRVTRLATGTAP